MGVDWILVMHSLICKSVTVCELSLYTRLNFRDKRGVV